MPSTHSCFFLVRSRGFFFGEFPLPMTYNLGGTANTGMLPSSGQLKSPSWVRSWVISKNGTKSVGEDLTPGPLPRFVNCSSILWAPEIIPINSVLLSWGLFPFQRTDIERCSGSCLGQSSWGHTPGSTKSPASVIYHEPSHPNSSHVATGKLLNPSEPQLLLQNGNTITL